MVVGNDRCLVELESLPSPIRTAELPLPTFKPLGCMPLPVPILMPPSRTVPFDRLASISGSGDITNERITNAVLMVEDFLPGIARIVPTVIRRRSIRSCPDIPRYSDTVLPFRTFADSLASRRRDTILYTRISVAVTSSHRCELQPLSETEIYILLILNCVKVTKFILGNCQDYSVVFKSEISASLNCLNYFNLMNFACNKFRSLLYDNQIIKPDRMW